MRAKEERRNRPALVLGLAVAALAAATSVHAQQPGAPPAPASTNDAAAEFLEVAKVLLSPRCKNCHPAGDAPLQTDASRAHSMNVSRKSVEAGLGCGACHRLVNAPGAGAPPGAEGWHMPSASVPMVFEGKTPAELCAQLKDTSKTNGRSVEAMIDHVAKDALVLWAWAPGEGRTTPPGSHADFVRHVTAWVRGGAACPR